MAEWRLLIWTIAGILLLANGPGTPSFGQRVPSSQRGAITIEGLVRDADGEPVENASVFLQGEGPSHRLQSKSAKNGEFVFTLATAGSYRVRAEKTGWNSAVSKSFHFSPGQRNRIDLILNFPSNPSAATSAGEVQLLDKPSFAIAGVTDWTSAGGHGSDVNLRTSEALAREVTALKPNAAKKSAPDASETNQSEKNLRAALTQAPNRFDSNHRLGEFYFRSQRFREAIPFLAAAYRLKPEDYLNAHDLALAYIGVDDLVRAREQLRRMRTNADSAEAHRLLGDLEERLDDPVAAVNDYERAARLDGSEQSYFAWGTELLLHHAVRPAIEVFSRGAKAHPMSARMQAGLGAALHASGSYEEAAQRLCQASDLDPENADPYVLLGKIAKASAAPLPCVESKLEKFAQAQPGNASASYYYAIALSKRPDSGVSASQKIEALLRKTLDTDPNFAEAYLQLGILHSGRGASAQALHDFQQAVQANANLVEAHYRLGTAYKKSGDESKAREEFKTYQRLVKLEAAQIEHQRQETRNFMVVSKGQQP